MSATKNNTITGNVRLCFNCQKIDEKKPAQMKTICGSCRDVLKYKLVLALLGQSIPILSKDEQNKKGRPDVLSKRQKRSVVARYRRGQSMQKLADYYGVSIGKIQITIPPQFRRRRGRKKKKKT